MLLRLVTVDLHLQKREGHVTGQLHQTHDYCVGHPVLGADELMRRRPDKVNLDEVEEGQADAEAEDRILVTQVVQEVVNVLITPDIAGTLDQHLLPVASVLAGVHKNEEEEAC